MSFFISCHPQTLRTTGVSFSSNVLFIMSPTRARTITTVNNRDLFIVGLKRPLTHTYTYDVSRVQFISWDAIFSYNLQSHSPSPGRSLGVGSIHDLHTTGFDTLLFLSLGNLKFYSLYFYFISFLKKKKRKL